MEESTRRSGDGAGKLPAILAVGSLALVVVLLALRLRYGVDVIDESYYAAGSLRFALGARPLLDDLGAHQFAAYLVAPLVWVWLQATHGTSGVVLGLRAVYFALSLSCAALSFAFLRRLFDWRIALLSLSMPLALVPALIFTLSYNTIVVLGVSAGVSAAGVALLEPRRHWMFVVSGAALGLAVVAYPTQAVTALIAVALVGALSRSWKAVLLMAGGVGAVLCAFALAVRPTLSGVADFSAYNGWAAGHEGWLTGFAKVLIVARGAVGATYLAPVTYLLVLLAIAALAHSRAQEWLTAVLPVAALLALHTSLPLWRTMTAAALLFICALLVGWRAVEGPARRVALFGLFVGLAAAVVCAYTSAEGFSNFGIGAAAVSALSLALLLEGARAGLSARVGEGRAMRVVAAEGAIAACIVLAMCWTTSFGMGAPLGLHVAGSGPYSGLLTSAEVASQTLGMQADLAMLSGPGDRIWAYGATPSVYLLSRGRPVSPNLFMTGLDGRTTKEHADFVTHWMGERDHRPSVVVVDADLWRTWRGGTRDYLLDAFSSGMHPAVERPGYVILTPRG